MPTLSLSDSVHSLTSDAALKMGDGTTVNYVQAINALNDTIPVSNVAVAASAATFTLKDGRSFVMTVQAGNPPKFRVSSVSFFTQQEFTLLQNVSQVITTMFFQFSLTTMTDTFV